MAAKIHFYEGIFERFIHFYEGKEQGLTSRQKGQRYKRERDKDSHVAKRKEEYFMSKGAKLLEMYIRQNEK